MTFLYPGSTLLKLYKNKNIFIDSILCKHILFYRPPTVALGPKAAAENPYAQDTAGFRKAYEP